MAARNLDRLGVSHVPKGWNLSTVGGSCSIKNEFRLPLSVEVRGQMSGEYAYYGPTGVLDWLEDFRVEGDFALIGEDGDHFMEPAKKPQTLRVSGQFNVNNHAHLVASGKTCSVDWFFHFFRHRDISHSLTRQGAGRFKLTKAALEKLPILLPPLPEQRKIAEILRTWDEAIEKLTALRTANLTRRVWMRSHLFTGLIRMPGYTGAWHDVTLGQVLTEHRLNGTGAEEVFSVSVHKGLINQIEHLGRSFAAADTSHYNRVLPGDIVYTKSPTGEFPLGIIKQSKITQEVIVSPLYGVFTPTTHALGVILDALFESPIAVRNYLHPLVQKGAKNTIAITNRRFLEGKLRLPMDPAEQAAIAEVVATTQAELACIDAEIEALTRQKRGLMQKLLTGEWRVTVDPTTPFNPAEETHDGR
jgi:type I restriction enzyme S subunit